MDQKRTASFRIDEVLLDSLREEATRQDVPVSSLVRRAIRAELARSGVAHV